MDKDLTPWYHPEWLSVSTLNAFTWEHTTFLYALIAIPFYLCSGGYGDTTSIRNYPSRSHKKTFMFRPSHLIRLIPELLLMLVLAFICLALARPQKTNEKVEQSTEGIDIMIALGYFTIHAN